MNPILCICYSLINGSNCSQVIQDPDLRERHLGVLQGLTSDEADKLKSNGCQPCNSSRTDDEIPVNQFHVA